MKMALPASCCVALLGCSLIFDTQDLSQGDPEQPSSVGGAASVAGAAGASSSGAPSLCNWYEDKDGDGFGRGDDVQMLPCGPPPKLELVSQGTDCDDANPNKYPGAPEKCDGLVDDCNEMTNSCLADCRAGAPLEGHGYVVCGSLFTGTEGEDVCARMGMHLVLINDAAENQHVQGLIQTLLVSSGANRTAWGSGSAPRGSTVWRYWDETIFFPTDLNPRYTNWRKGQPNEAMSSEAARCLLLSESGEWESAPCSSLAPAVCERVP